MQWRRRESTGAMPGMAGLKLRLRIAQARWPELRSTRQRLAMVAWVAGLTDLAARLMHR